MNATRVGSLLAAVAFPALAASAVRAQSTSEVFVASGDWKRADKAGPQTCQVETSIGGSQRRTISISANPGADDVSFFLRGKAPAIVKRGARAEIQVVVGPSGETYDAAATQYPDPQIRQPVLSLSELPEAFLTSVSEGTGLILQLAGRPYLRVTLSGMQQAVAALRECSESLLKKWGLNADHIASLKRKPRPVKGVRVFSPDDYPTSALRRNEQGTAVVRFTVDTDGSARNCSTVISSGSEALDSQTCKSILSRAKFLPAVDRNGSVTAVEIAESIRWALFR